jgi:hypothetical protein
MEVGRSLSPSHFGCLNIPIDYGIDCIVRLYGAE